MHKFWAIVFGGVMAGAFLLSVAAPFAGWWLPKDVSTFGGGIDALFYVILAVTGFFFILTEVILVYALFRFAGQPGRRGTYVHGNHQLELIWTFIPGVLLFLLAIVQINVWADVKYQSRMPKPGLPPGDPQNAVLQMEVSARQWEWRIRYPSSTRLEAWDKNPELAKDFAGNPHEDDVRLVNEVHVWKGSMEQRQNVLVHLKTQDVIHSFFLPNLRLKQDALPGKTIPVWFAVTEANVVPQVDPKTNEKRWVEEGYDPKTGKAQDLSMIWELACAEFCGARHSMMRGKLYVHKDKADFLDWLKDTEAAQRRTQPSITTASR